LIAGLYGLVAILPMYFGEARYGEQYPPAIAHPEFFYGFIGVVVAWQVAFLVIASDPARYRPLMVPAMLEKFTFVAAIIGLLVSGRTLPSVILLGAGLDFVLGVLFVLAFRASRPRD
jgi:purine-cytosine permease-like protein